MAKRKYTSPHDNEVRIDFANKIKDYLADIENKIVEERNKPQSIADSRMLVGMQVCVEDFLSWLDNNTKETDIKMEEEIQYMLEQEREMIESKFAHLSWLAKKLNITDRDKLKEVLEFARLFNECNKNGWIDLEPTK